MPNKPERKARIHYARVDEFWRKEEKYAFLDEKQHRGNIDWREIKPDAKNNWLTEGMQEGFEAFIPIGTREAKASSKPNTQTMFETYGRGVATSRDSWAYNFSESELVHNIIKTIDAYNALVSAAASSSNKSKSADELIVYDAHAIAWSRDLKLDLERGKEAEFADEKVREALYRPFAKSHLFFDRVLNEEVYIFPSIFPTRKTEQDNRVVCLTGQGSEKPFMTLASNKIVDLHLASPGCSTQCFPFYSYNEDGTNRCENITDWALEQFRSHYRDKSITKWDIFHYVYAALHHPLYRERYAANLKRELPRIPFAPDFKSFADIGKRLAEIHVNYEQQPEYPLERIETPGQPLDWRVEKMKLSKDKRSLIYNDFLTLSGIPPEVLDYRLGNRSALEWIIDQYQVSTDKRSGITNDPNRDDDPEYIVRLIGQVITVSVETVSLVDKLSNQELIPSK
jgi:predicted helicase